MSAVATFALPLTLAVLMFGMGLALTPAAFGALRRTPWTALADLGSLSLGLPLIAWAIGLALGASPETRSGLLLIGACPAGTLSMVAASYARGDLALSVLLLALSSLLSVLVTPSVLHLLGPAVGLGAHSVALPFGDTVSRVALVIALPVALGMIVRRLAGERVLPLHRAIKSIGGVVVLAIFGALIAAHRAELGTAFATFFVPVVAYNLAAAALGLLVATLTRAQADRRVSLLLAHQVRQEETGLFLALTILGTPALALPLLLNSVVGMASALITLASVRLGSTRQQSPTGRTAA